MDDLSCNDRCRKLERKLRAQINYLKNKHESVRALLETPYTEQPLSEKEFQDPICKRLHAERHGLLFVENVIRGLLGAATTTNDCDMEEPPEKFLPLETSTPSERCQSLTNDPDTDSKSNSSYSFEAGQRWSLSWCNKTSPEFNPNEEFEGELQTNAENKS